jgi:hypothetical protein
VESIAVYLEGLGDLPILERLDIDWITSIDLNAFQIAPKLHTARLHFVTITRVQLPWLQMRSFTIISCSLQQISDAVMRSPALGSLSIQVPEDDDEDPAGGGAWHWTSGVRDLEVVGDASNLHDVLVNATTPSLSSLCITIPKEIHFDTVFPVQQCTDFLTRSACMLTLRRLFLENTTITEESLVSLLRLVPHIEDFTLDLPHYEDDPAEFLTHQLLLEMRKYSSYSSTTLLPNLKKLCLALDDIEQAMFVDMVASRLLPDLVSWDDQCTRIRAVHLTLRSCKFNASLKPIPREGLDLQISDSSGHVLLDPLFQ